MSLVEVLVAVALLSAVAVPILNGSAITAWGAPFQRQIAVNLVTSKVEELGDQAYLTNAWPGSGLDVVEVGQFQFSREWIIIPYTPTNDDYPAERNQLRKAVVRVSCSNCPRAFPPVKVVAVLEKL